MLGKGQDTPPRRRGGVKVLSSGLVVAAGTALGNLLAYGFNLALSRRLGPQGYAELGTLLAVFLIGSVAGLAVQAVAARRLAVAADGPPDAHTDLCRRLRTRGLLAGVAVALLFAALAPMISVLLPSVTSAGVAWTGVSLAAFTVFSSYLGLAQGTQRFGTMTLLFVTAHATRLFIGVGAAGAGASPTTVMAAQTAAWALAAVAGHRMLRELTTLRVPVGGPAPAGPGATAPAVAIPAPRTEPDPNPARPVNGYLPELLRACGGLGGIILLANLDVVLAGRYLTDGDLGRYNTAGLISRAAFFAPAFIAMLAFPHLARPGQRRRALGWSLTATGAFGVAGVALAYFGGDPLITAAFGAKYGDAAGAFDLGSHGWVFAASGGLLALVNLALLDGVARRSHTVSVIVLAGIGAEVGAIVAFAHHSPNEIITAAACCSLATAVASVTACLRARTTPRTRTLPATDAVGAGRRSS